MKIAFILFGQPRFVDNLDIFNKYKIHILDRYDTDVYAHCWFDANNAMSVSSWSGLDNILPPKNSITTIMNNYTPVNFLHEAPRVFKFGVEAETYLDEKFPKIGNRSNVLSQLYSIQAAARLIKNKEKYERIVLARYDTLLINFVDLAKLKENHVYVPNNTLLPMGDIITIMSNKHLVWIENIYDNAHLIYKDVVEPIPEQFKYHTFKLNFSDKEIIRHGLRPKIIRS